MLSRLDLAGALDRIGAHTVPERTRQERDRALLRAVVGASIAAVWATRWAFGQAMPADPWFAACLGLALPLVSLGYRRFLVSSPAGGVALQYLFLVLDPAAVVGVLVQDPQTFAFLSPLLLLVVVGSGAAYGVRTMYLALAASLSLSVILFASPFWRSRLDLTLAHFLLLALVPAFFDRLVRRGHAMRAVEADRNRSVALQQDIVARSAFLAKVSHELRSPLQGIVSALDVIEMRHARAFDEDRELIGRMRRASMLLNTQLRDLLTLAKGEAGRLEIHAEPFEACSLVEAMAEGARDAALAKGLQVLVEVPDGPVFVRADGARIDQILTNLAMNSIRYTDAGRVAIAMRTEGLPVSLLEFVVSDTGAGIPEALLPTLFAPDKVLNNPARRGEGSGIGLAIVRLLVDRLGGTLAVASRVGEGTVFTLRIPVQPVQ
jgi:signal transduction histidine kinase